MGVERQEVEYGKYGRRETVYQRGFDSKNCHWPIQLAFCAWDILFIKVGVGRTGHEGESFSGYLQNNDGKYLCDMRVVGSSHHEAMGAIRRTAWKDDQGLYLERVIISSHLAAY